MENKDIVQNNTNFEKIKKVHFVGIGGVSVSALARLSMDLGMTVSGSDVVTTICLYNLQREGVGIHIGHLDSNIPEGCDLVVYSGAVDKRNIELVTARKLGIPTMERSEYLALLASRYDNVIAVSGSHGKTSTTAMIGHIFAVAKLNPTVHLGGTSLNFGALRLGGKGVFVTEACEYRESMGTLNPNTTVITNIDNDHLDYYKTKKNLISAFQRLDHKTKDNVVVGSERLLRWKYRTNNLVSAGLNAKQDVYAYDITQKDNGYVFKISAYGKSLGKFRLNQYGKHNVRNAVFAISVALLYGISHRTIKKALKTYKGVERRYERVSTFGSIPIISDYAHHPTEIDSSLRGLKSHFNNILVVFQPHTYSRTKILLDQFAKCFADAKTVIIYPTYPARERYDASGDEKTLYNAITNKDKYLAEDTQAVRDIVCECSRHKKYDCIVLMGAGDMPQLLRDF